MKQMKKLFLVAGILLLVFGISGIAVAGPYPVEEFLNGSFEDGASFSGNHLTLGNGSTVIPGWTVGGDSIDWIQGDPNSDKFLWEASDGNYSLDLSGDDAGSISQTFSTLAGATYDVAFDLAGNPVRQIDKVLEVSAWSGSDLLASKTYTFKYDDGQTKADMGWITFDDFSFLGTGDDVKLVFASLTGGDGGPALDNVVVTDAPAANAPEPATMLLLGSGLIGLAGLGRKKFFNKAS